MGTSKSKVSVPNKPKGDQYNNSHQTAASSSTFPGNFRQLRVNRLSPSIGPRRSNQNHLLNQILRQLSYEIIPSDDYIQEGNIIANKVLDILRKERNDIDRVKIGGSVGKKTTVGQSSDFDLVVFLNGKLPPFDIVLEEMSNALKKHQRVEFFEDFKITNVTDRLIALEIDGYEFDLSPAPNFSEAQWMTVMAKIIESENPFKCGPYYGPGLTEMVIDFMKQQSEFVHCVVRLAKYWNSKILFPKKLKGKKCYIGGRSLMMELLAINACKNVNENDFYSAFKKFLTDVSNFENLHIYFDNYYSTQEIPPNVWDYDGPLILDPVNYYNNLAHHKNIVPQEPVIAIFKQVATASLTMLDNWKENSHVQEMQQFYIDGLFSKFEVQ